MEPNSFVSFSLSLPFSSLLLPIPSSYASFPCIGCEYPASEKSDQTDSQGSVSQHHWGCQSMLVPSCPTMHRARPTLLLPLLLVLGLLLHLADAQSKWTAGFHVGLKCCVPLVCSLLEFVLFIYFLFFLNISRHVKKWTHVQLWYILETSSWNTHAAMYYETNTSRITRSLLPNMHNKFYPNIKIHIQKFNPKKVLVN